jgi:signal transduction histidine kinase
VVRVLLALADAGESLRAREALARTGWFLLERVSLLSAALARLSLGGIDVVLLDLALPDGRGAEALLALHRHAPRVPIVALAAPGEGPGGLEVWKGGAEDLLVKGRFDGAMLARALRFAAERHRAQEALRAATEERREVERLKELEGFKTQFFRTITHELHTPLTPLKVYAHMLKSGELGPLNGEQLRAVQSLDRNVERMSDLVEAILDVASIQSGRLHMHQEDMDLDGEVRAVADGFREAAARARLELRVAAHEGLRARADRSRLRQVLRVLLDNAMKFTPPGGCVEVSARREGDEAVLRVRDSGVGLDAAQLAGLFQPFGQVRDALKETRVGMGLGLYIAKAIVELHGGRISCESPGPGKGATFVVAIPLGADPPLPLAAAAARVELPPGWGRR